MASESSRPTKRPSPIPTALPPSSDAASPLPLPSNSAADPAAEAFESAWQLVRRWLHRTPVVPCRFVSALLGRPDLQAFAKLESRQIMGSFKARGALVRLSQPDAERAPVILCASAGNLALAISWASRLLNLRATIACHQDMPHAKRTRLSSLAALTIHHPADLDHTERYTQALNDARPHTLSIPRSPDPHILSGYATLARELVEDLPRCDAIICPVATGALARSIRLWLDYKGLSIPIFGVQSEDNAAMTLSFARQRAIPALPFQPTHADELIGGLSSADFWETQAALADLVTVSEESIGRAMALLFTHLGEVVEGSAATTLAALLEGKLPPTLRRPCIILTGRNVDRDRLDEQFGPPRIIGKLER